MVDRSSSFVPFMVPSAGDEGWGNFFRNIMQGCGVYSPIWTRKDSRLQVVNRKTIWDLFKPVVSSISMPSARMHGCWFYYWLSGLAFMARVRVRREAIRGL